MMADISPTLALRKVAVGQAAGHTNQIKSILSVSTYYWRVNKFKVTLINSALTLF